MNFRDYILSEKMEYAKSLICAQNCSITEIAYQIGYQDYRSFSRAFKNTVGMSPSEYLNAASKNTSPWKDFLMKHSIFSTKLAMKIWLYIMLTVIAILLVVGIALEIFFRHYVANETLRNATRDTTYAADAFSRNMKIF